MKNIAQSVRKPFGLLIALVITFTLSATLTSCDGDDWGDYYYSPLCGSWQLQTINGYPAMGSEIVEFDFYGNGTGYYYQAGSQYSITWSADNGSAPSGYLEVYTWDGQLWSYQYDVRGNMLRLYDLDTSDALIFYGY